MIIMTMLKIMKIKFVFEVLVYVKSFIFIKM